MGVFTHSNKMLTESEKCLEFQNEGNLDFLKKCFDEFAVEQNI